MVHATLSRLIARISRWLHWHRHALLMRRLCAMTDGWR